MGTQQRPKRPCGSVCGDSDWSPLVLDSRRHDVSLNIGNHNHSDDDFCNICLGQDNDSVLEAKMDLLVDSGVMGTLSCGELQLTLMNDIALMSLCPSFQEVAGPVCC